MTRFGSILKEWSANILHSCATILTTILCMHACHSRSWNALFGALFSWNRWLKEAKTVSQGVMILACERARWMYVLHVFAIQGSLLFAGRMRKQPCRLHAHPLIPTPKLWALLNSFPFDPTGTVCSWAELSFRFLSYQITRAFDSNKNLSLKDTRKSTKSRMRILTGGVHRSTNL